MLNLVIQMCREGPVLGDLQYLDHLVEQKVSIEGGEVTPEIIVYSHGQRHTILWEFKSGGNLDRDQLDRYGDVDCAALIRADVPDAVAACHDICIVVPAPSGPCPQVIAELGHPFPLVERAAKGLKLVSNGFQKQCLTDAFSVCVELPEGAITINYVPLDGDSPNWAYALYVGRAVVDSMIKCEPRVSVDDVIRKTFLAHSSLSERHRSECLEPRIATVLDQLTAHEFSEYLRAEGRGAVIHDRTWEIHDCPFRGPINYARRQEAERHLQTLVRQAVDRLRATDDQPSLLEEGDL